MRWLFSYGRSLKEVGEPDRTDILYILTEEARKAYIEDYWVRMPDKVPDEYSRPYGSPYVAYVNKETFAKVSASKNGVGLAGNPLR